MSTTVQHAIERLDRDVSLAGSWQLLVRAPIPKAPPENITFFRGMPVTINNFGFTDPFGPSSMEFVVPNVSMFEQRGVGDLKWAVKHTDVTLVWDGELPAGYPHGFRKLDNTVVPAFRWEGYLTTFGFGTGQGLRCQAKGAMLQLDNWLAKPEYAARPLPYEWAISRQFLRKPALRMMPLRIVWPTWWTKIYVPVPKDPSWMIPAGVSAGDKWSGLLTRETGSWDPVLTSYLQTLINAMYTDRGRFTLMLDINRQPVMYHQDLLVAPNNSTIVVDPVLPGVKLDLTEDWDQCLTDVYAQGTSLAGVSYSGMQVSADGQATYYQPMAALRQTYPTSVDNGWFDRDVMPKEVMLQAQQGLAADDAAIVARSHLSRFADPGLTGTITLSSDPTLNGQPIHRMLVRAGMPVQVPHLGGNERGVLFHVTQSSADVNNGSVNLTVDSKFRDALTVQEVRQRGRDSLAVSRMLVAGQYQPPIPDQMWPWSYAEGAGYIPSNPVYSSVPLFNGMPPFTPFPWVNWLKSRPPSNRRWRNCYIGIGPANANADRNWSRQSTPAGFDCSTPIRMSQAGTVKLLQICAVDYNGAPLRVPFHVGFYYINTTRWSAMPAIPAQQAARFPPYKANQRYPFWQDAFETIKKDGTLADMNDPNSYQSCGPVRIYGTYYEKAGYYPGSYADGDAPTGLLVDTTQWSWDLTNNGAGLWDPHDIEKNFISNIRGFLFMLIYCDAQQDQSVYFVGRIFRVEPGVGGSGA